MGEEVQGLTPPQPDPLQASAPAPQPNYVETAPTSDPFVKQKQFYQQQIAQNTPADRNGVKGLLSNFFQGMGSSMMHQAGLPTPYDKVQQAQQGLDRIQQLQSTVQMHESALKQAVLAQQAMQRSPSDPSLSKFGIDPSVPMTDAERVKAMMQFTGNEQKGDTATSVQGMKGDTAVAVQGQKSDAAALARQDKLSMFKQTMDYKLLHDRMANQTRLQVAGMSQNKAPAAIMQTAEFALSGQNRLRDAKSALAGLEQRGILGSVPSNKLEDWIFGKGLVDPSLSPQDKTDIGRLRAALTYTSSAAMRAHTGRSSREIYDDFKRTMGLNQSSEALKGAIGETDAMLNDYATGATDKAIAALRGRASAPNAPSAAGNAGARHFAGGSANGLPDGTTGNRGQFIVRGGVWVPK